MLTNDEITALGLTVNPNNKSWLYDLVGEIEKAVLSKLAIPDEQMVEKLEDKFVSEMITIGDCVENAKTGQMFRYDAERLSKIAYSQLAPFIQAQKGEEERKGIKTKVICLSGSTRFTNEMMMLTWEYAKKGIIALGWCILPSNHNSNGSEIDHHLAEKEGVAEILDELHLRKIDLSDEVFVVNVGGYIGEGTKREIAYAIKIGKPISYLEAIKGVTTDGE